MKSILLFFFAQTVFASQPQVPIASIDFWNESNRVYDNNCYNYGTNRVTNSFAQPGEASGISLSTYNCPEVFEAASADLGLTVTEFFDYNGKEDDTLIAVVASGDDYHWYRRDDGGMWSHKMGGTPATEQDNSGNTISSPETADRGDYTQFCGYFRIKNFPVRADEQDAGYVRVGNMKSLPILAPQSEVRVLKYSGRRNPTFLLKDYLADPQFKQQLTNISNQMAMAPLAAMSKVVAMNKLGYNGLLIVDHEGLIFPAGSRVQILDTTVIAHIANAAAPLQLSIAKPLAVEQSFNVRR